MKRKGYAYHNESNFIGQYFKRSMINDPWIGLAVVHRGLNPSDASKLFSIQITAHPVTSIDNNTNMLR
jgi:hypothetical protein